LTGNIPLQKELPGRAAIRELDEQRWTVMRFLNSRMRYVDQLVFTRDGRRLFAASSNVLDIRNNPEHRGADVFDLLGGSEPIIRLFADYRITGFAVNPAGRWLYLGTDSLSHRDDSALGYWLHDLESGASSHLGLRGANSFALGIHPSGEWLIGFGYLTEWETRRLIRWRQPPAGSPVQEWEIIPPTNFYTCHVACDPDGTRVITQDLESNIFVTKQVYELTIRDPSILEARETVLIPGRTVDQLQFSPDGSRLVIRAGTSLLVWDARDLSRKPQKIRGERKGHFTGLAFHPTGRYLAATNHNETVTLFDTESWRPAATYAWDIGRMRSVAFSPDGALAAAGSDTSQIVIWDVDL
jgi:WD40 repeat protein